MTNGEIKKSTLTLLDTLQNYHTFENFRACGGNSRLDIHMDWDTMLSS